MKEKLDRFISNLNGQFVEVSYKSAPYQCMDLAYTWIFALDIPKATIQHGAAYQVWSEATDLTREYFDLLENTPDFVPQDGDLAVWGDEYGKYGHIGIALGGGTTHRFYVFEQNNPLGTNAHVQQRGYSHISGFLRPKKRPENQMPQWWLPFANEHGLDLGNEGQIRELFGKAISYDDKVKELTEQVKSANETLADKALEVSLLTDKVTNLENKEAELTERLNKTRLERDEATFKADRYEIENKKLAETVEDLNEKIEVFEENKFKIIFKIGKLFIGKRGGE